MSKEEFIQLSNNQYNNKYSYNLVVDNICQKDKVKIICPEHGEFNQRCDSHLKGNGCKICSLEKRSKESLEKRKGNFLKKSIHFHNNKYDYSMVEYINSTTLVKIICPEHGMFEQSPMNHLKGGCLKCSYKIRNINTNFFNTCNKKFNNKYDYSKSIYINNIEKIKIKCPTHGYFKQSPQNHLNIGCSKCNKDYRDKLRLKEIKLKIKGKYGDIFDYSTLEYYDSDNDNYKRTKIKILNKLSGDFLIKCPSNIMKTIGTSSISVGEMLVEKVLKDLKIKYQSQYRFDECRNKKPLPFDFYCPNLNLCIEYNGIQHYQPVDYFGGNKRYVYQKKCDDIKENFCSDNDINLIVLKYDMNIEDIYEKINTYI